MTRKWIYSRQELQTPGLGYRRQRGQATWVPDPEQEISLPCDISLQAPLSVVFSYHIKCFYGFAQCNLKRNVALRNNNFVLLAQRKGETLSLNEDTQVDPRASVGTVHAS